MTAVSILPVNQTYFFFCAAFRGTLEENVIYHVIVQATPRLRERLCKAGTCDSTGVPVELPQSATFETAAKR